MTNEAINETEESVNNDNSVIEETKTETSPETAAEEIPVLSSEESTAEETAVLPAETPAAEEPAITDSPVSAEEAQNQSDVNFGDILKEFEQDQTVYHTGELVEGKVVGVSERGILVDFGHKSEGIIPIEEFTTPEGEVTVKIGDDVEVVVKKINAGDSPPILSRTDALNRKSWELIEKAHNENKPITGRVVGKTKGGLRVDIGGIEAFLPGSQIDSRPIRNLDSFRDKEIEAKVIKFSRKRNNVVISRKVLTDEIVNRQKTEALNSLKESYVVEGTIRNLTEYGAFVNIGGIDGLLHVTDMSWGRLQNPNQLFKVNDHIQVKVLKLDPDHGKVSLGYKQLIPDPWSTVMEVYPIDAKVKGTVSSITEYGAFIELEPGVEGLVHVSEMSWSKRSKSPRKLVNAGEEVEVLVLGIDTDDRRISLGMKQLQENPWETILERFHVGSTVRGKVRNLTDFGAFVEIEEGIDGLVHVSDISHSKKIKHPKDVLKRDQEVEAVITSIDTQGHRMSLSIKELTPSSWISFVASHKTGDVVKGRVSRFAGFGVFVELGNELEGLCHISELSDERVERPEDVVSIGQEMDFKILRIEHDENKIALSHRAVNKKDEPAIDSKAYSTEAKGGMASLGELMNLKRGVATEEITEEPKLSKKERKAIKAKEKAEAETTAETERASAETTGTETAEAADLPVEDTETAQVASEESSVEEAETAAEPIEEKPVEVASDETAEAEVAEEKSAETVKVNEVNEQTTETRAEKEQAGETADSKSETVETETQKLTDIEGEAASATEVSEPTEDVVQTNNPKSDTEKADATENTEETAKDAEDKTA
ncbi:MAG: 30S ribosomal protein S1 [Acidobacteriota bacterium]|nr:30S ribosomal protein S1 [Acidobacteriota bacterium]